MLTTFQMDAMIIIGALLVVAFIGLLWFDIKDKL